MLTIGQLARRVGVTPRAIRHYESIGLLAPADVDGRTGYRSYGAEQLVRAVQIEQLKAAGLRLAEIGQLLDSAARQELLARRRAELGADIAARQRALRLLDALVETGALLGAPRLVTLPSTPVITEPLLATAATLAPVVQRGVQRLRRRVRAADPDAAWVFGSRFPIAIEGPVTVEVTATHPALDVGRWPPTDAVAVEVVGPHELLPAAYDAALAVAESARCTAIGVVRETYGQLGRVLHTTVVIPVTRGGRDPAGGATRARHAGSRRSAPAW